MPLRFDRATEEQFLNRPAIAEVATIIVNHAKKTYSDQIYAKLGIELQVSWSETEAFRAGAYIAKNGNHEIRLSYGTAIEIYRDAFVLPETCQRVFINSAFDPIFNLLNYGNKRQDVLPAGLSTQEAKVEIIRLMTTWLYLHEQAHLLQRHGDVATAQGASELLSNDKEIVDVVQNAPILEGRDAAISHAFEFAADYEAITILVMLESIGVMSEAKVWCLAAGLMCMFQRFYGTSSMAVGNAPSGSHPHPGIRMLMVMKRVKYLFAQPEIAAAAKWTMSPSQVQAIMDHAVYTATVFWQLRYLGLDARSPFLDTVVANLAVPSSYQSAIFDIWRSMRPKIVAGHLGHGEGVVMFLRAPGVIGSRD